MKDNWYAVQVRTGHEQEIVDKCQVLIQKDILKDCFIPRCKRLKKFRGEWKNVEEILFKGYVFMITDCVDDLYVCLKKIPDLTKILGNDGEYIAPLYDDEVSTLLKYGGSQHMIDMSYGFIKGDVIHVTSGPLQGQEGQIVKIDRHKRVAYVDVKLFDRITRIQVGLEIISKD